MKLHLVHWNPDEAAQRLKELTAAGHDVAYVGPGNTNIMKHIRASAPQAVVLDLTRMPSHSRAVATAIRGSSTHRSVPIVFAGGEPEKVAIARATFPDAIYAEWGRIKMALRKAKPVSAPVVPPNYMAQYAGRPLAQKLGAKSGMKIAAIDAPDHFERAVADFPFDVEWQERPVKSTELVFLFADSQAGLEANFPRAASSQLPIWVFWPKQSSGMVTDLTQHLARTVGHAFGYTDCKVCAFDATWSGFLFRLKRA